MARPRKYPLPQSADAEKLLSAALDEVKATLRDAGIEIPLTVWIEAQQAAAALLPSKGIPAATTPAAITTNGVPSNV